jgi:S1-C subfamily serine protease
MRQTLAFVLTLFSLPIAACGGSSAEGPSAQTAQAPAPSEPVAEEPPPPPSVEGEISRADLTVVLDAGLGRFLQGVVTEPELDNGRFMGFRIVSLYPDDDRMRSVDLAAGDVITLVNGQPIERPEQAMRVWSSLRVASELLVDYRREGEERQLRFAIVD